MSIRRALSLFFVIQLSACGDGPSAAGPGGVTADDAQALDDAASKLEADAARQPEPGAK